MSPRRAFFTAFIMEFSEKLFDVLPAAKHSNRTVSREPKISSTPPGYVTLNCCAVSAAVFPGRNIPYLKKSTSYVTLKAGNEPVATLVLNLVEGGGDHLPSFP